MRLLTRYYDADKEAGSAEIEEKKEPTAAEKRQAERDSIKVESNQKEQDEKDGKKSSEEEKKEEVSEEETEAEEGEEQIEASEKKEEDLEAEKLEAKSQKEKDRIQKRIDKEVAKRKKLEDENADLKRQLAAKPDAEKVLTEDDVEKRAERKAEDKVATREFINACNRLADAAKKVDKDFKKKIDEVAEDYAPIPGVMIAILDDMDNGGEVLSYLASNPEEYGEVCELPEGKMGRQLQKLSDKLEVDKKPKPKVISKAPKPNEPVGGNRQSPNQLREGMSMDEFVRVRNAQVTKRQEERRRGLRS